MLLDCWIEEGRYLPRSGVGDWEFGEWELRVELNGFMVHFNR